MCSRTSHAVTTLNTAGVPSSSVRVNGSVRSAVNSRSGMTAHSARPRCAE